jgi:YggT family protein
MTAARPEYIGRAATTGSGGGDTLAGARPPGRTSAVEGAGAALLLVHVEQCRARALEGDFAEPRSVRRPHLHPGGGAESSDHLLGVGGRDPGDLLGAEQPHRQPLAVRAQRPRSAAGADVEGDDRLRPNLRPASYAHRQGVVRPVLRNQRHGVAGPAVVAADGPVVEGLELGGLGSGGGGEEEGEDHEDRLTGLRLCVMLNLFQHPASNRLPGGEMDPEPGSGRRRRCSALTRHCPQPAPSLHPRGPTLRERMMLLALIGILLILLTVAWWIIVIQMVLSWLVAFNVINTYNNFVRGLMRGLDRITEPVYRPIRKVLPDFGGLDFSPMVVIIVLLILHKLLEGVASDVATSSL